MRQSTDNSKQITAYVALSGGVDSAVSAALLQQQGYDVVGVHMKMYVPAYGADACSWQTDMEAAREVAEHLRIPFEVWDFTAEYEREVVEYMVAEYEAGRTPNPDVMCNRHIKFGLFYDRAMAQAADFIATGHYARIRQTAIGHDARNVNRQSSIGRKTNDEQRNGHRNRQTNYELLRGVDPNKDQSYFLWAIPKQKLAKILFPVGHLTKPQVRALARQFGLPNAKRKDSQGICFIGKLDLEEFLKLKLPAREGETLTAAGEPVSTHRGAWFYTIGQRHGFGGGGGLPHYVAQKNVAQNRLTVVPRGDERLYSRRATVGSLNWFADADHVEMQARYRQKPISGSIRKHGNDRIEVEFREPAWALAAGQSMVLYDGDRVVAGGSIESAS